MRQLLFGVVALCACAASAFAQEAPFWTQMPIEGGCTVAVPTEAPPPSDTAFSWDGACATGQGVTGQGAVVMSFRGADGEPYAATARGEWIGGFPHGRFEMQVRDAQGRLLRESQTLYNMGCAADGREPGCEPGAAE